MPFYLVRFRYTQETWSDLISAPTNREPAAKEIFQRGGCQLHGLWYSLDGYDGYELVEAPNETAVGAVVTEAAGGGRLDAIVMTRLISGDEMVAMLQAAQRLRSDLSAAQSSTADR